MKKLLIDTDPGVDDAMAILCAFNSPLVEVVGLTTTYGNVPTKLATKNALRLLEVAGMTQGQACSKSAAQFIVDMVNANPGEVSILALAALTNVAHAIQLDPTITSKWGELVVLGGAFFVNGNVNPAAEANIFGDPDAADFVLGQSSNIKVIGLDTTHSCCMTAAELSALEGAGKYGTFVAGISAFYLQYHKKAYGFDAIYVHDPTAFIGVIAPELFTWRRGAVRVVLDGVAKGHTIMDAGMKTWMGTNPWLERCQVEVALQVDSERLTTMVKQLLAA